MTKFKENQRILNRMLLKSIKELSIQQKCHNETHIVEDILPQFTALCKKVELMEKLIGTCDKERRIAYLEDKTQRIWEGSTEQNQATVTLLKALPEIEILKTQVAGVLKSAPPSTNGC